MSEQNGNGVEKTIRSKITAAMSEGHVRVPDIALAAGLQSGDVYSNLIEMVGAGLVQKTSSSGGNFWHLVDIEAEPVPRPEEPLPDEQHVKALRDAGSDNDPIFERLDALINDEKDDSKECKALVTNIVDRIFTAIDAQYCTLGGIKRHIRAPRSFDLDWIIAGLVVNHKIRKDDNGTVTAYFRYETKPLSWKLIGDGRVDAKWDPDFKPRDEQAKAVEMNSWAKPDPDEENPLELGDGTEKAKRGKKRVEIDEELLENHAASEKTQEAVAKKLGVSSALLYARTGESPVLKAAYDRGREQYRKSHPQTPAAKPASPAVAAARREAAPSPARSPAKVREGKRSTGPTGITWTPQMFKDAASRGLTVSAFAKELDVDYGTITYQLKKPDNRAAWDEGVKIHAAAAGVDAPAPRPTRSKKAAAKKTRQRKSDEKPKAAVAIVEEKPKPHEETNGHKSTIGMDIGEEANAPPSKALQSSGIKLSNGAIMVAIDVDLFTATREDLNAIADITEAFRAAQAKRLPAEVSE